MAIPLATPADLEAYGVCTDDVTLTTLALDAASAAVRDAAGTVISRGTSTFTVEGDPYPWLALPVSPVVSVAAVEIDGDPVVDWRLISGQLWRRAGWAGCDPSLVSVTATYGYDPVPADIVLLVAELAGAVMAAASEGGVQAKVGVQSERIDDYYVAYETGAGGSVASLELPERLRLSLRRRFGGGVYVTDTR